MNSQVKPVLDTNANGGPYYGFSYNDWNPGIFISTSQDTLALRYKDGDSTKDIVYKLQRTQT